MASGKGIFRGLRPHKTASLWVLVGFLFLFFFLFLVAQAELLLILLPPTKW